MTVRAGDDIERAEVARARAEEWMAVVNADPPGMVASSRPMLHGAVHFLGEDVLFLLAALDRLQGRLASLNDEANALTQRAEHAETVSRLLRLGMERIRDEPPDRGLTPNFRQFAADCLDSLAALESRP